MSKVNFKSLCKMLNAHAESSAWKAPASIKVELTSFQPVHKVGRGRNGVSELLELQTRIIEADGIHIDTWERSNGVAIYVSSRSKSAHGFGSDRGSFLRVRDAKGKYHSLEVATKWEFGEIEVTRMQSLFGYESAADFAPEEYAEFAEEAISKVVKIVDDSEQEEEINETLGSKQVKREFTVKFYRDLVRDLDDSRTEELEKFLTHIGFKLVRFFSFTDRFWGIFPEYADQTSQGFEIGWTTRQTYNSLPVVLRVTKVREIKTVKLHSIGVEQPGYYSHSDTMRIRPEQVDAAKRFAARFRAKKSSVINKLVRTALKVA